MFDAARKLMEIGPRFIIIKKGEHGSILLTPEDVFLAHAYPVGRVIDPTGAGDSFAGGFLGYLALKQKIDAQTLREAVVNGSVVASFTVEDFSFNALARMSAGQVQERTRALQGMVTF